MTDPVRLQTNRSRLGEVALWATAAVLTISVHAGAAYYLFQDPDISAGEQAPPAAIMIELAPVPEAVKTEETVEAKDEVEQEEVKSAMTEAEPQPDTPPEPTPEPMPEPAPEEPTPPAAEPVVNDPQPTPEPPPEVAAAEPQEVPPEPVQEVDPIEQQQMAALDNVEVPLPAFRPPPPPVEKKIDKPKEPEQRKTQKPAPPPPRSEKRDVAKAETTPSDRTAAPRTSGGLFSSAMTPAKWQSRIRSQIVRKKPSSLRANGKVVTVNFRVSESGSLSGIRMRASTGDPALDQQIIAWIERSSPVAAPPPDAARDVTLPIAIK